MPLDVYTAKMGYRGPDWLDVSLQGNMRRGDTPAGGHRGIGFWFAPPPMLLYPMLSARKFGRETPALQAEYRERYLEHLRARYRSPARRAFDELLSWPRVVLLCFCKSGEFCHRRLLAEVLVKMGAVDRGELAPGAEPDGPPFWRSQPTEREVSRAVESGAATPLPLLLAGGERVTMGQTAGRCTPFEVVKDGKRVGGGFICGPRGRKTRCKGSPSCARLSSLLCDFPLDGKKKGKTCDIPLCATCARTMAADLHYCPVHHSYDPDGAKLRPPPP